MVQKTFIHIPINNSIVKYIIYIVTSVSYTHLDVYKRQMYECEDETEQLEKDVTTDDDTEAR